MSDARRKFLAAIEECKSPQSLRNLAKCKDPDVAEKVVLNKKTDTETLKTFLNYPTEYIQELAEMALTWRKPPRNSSGSPREEEGR